MRSSVTVVAAIAGCVIRAVAAHTHHIADRSVTVALARCAVRAEMVHCAHLAVRARISFLASAAVGADPVDALPIDAGVAGALVNVGFAVVAIKSIMACARVFVNSINASTLVLARVAGALVSVGLAVCALVSSNTSAAVRVFEIVAGGTVLARARESTLINIHITMSASPATIAAADAAAAELARM